MILRPTILTAILLTTNIIIAQKKIPVIQANSVMVDIKEDNILEKDVWQISPDANPDVYITSAKKVTFYTDIDSISFDVKPSRKYDFIILLNNKDSARTQIIWEPLKIDVLKKAAEYNFSDNRSIPEFSYQSQSNPDLLKIRKDLKLDSIAGNGNELAKILNLMHWVHNLVKHDGRNTNPTLKNAIDLIKVCRAENRGVNCRMLATILNDCYLSMGIKSRQITCMPRETVFDDCHVINMVYSTELNKWIWIDPTFDAYIMDENGGLLGIQEVRERLIKDLPLILNVDANWNREVLQTKEYYLDYYMAKNLYRLQTPLISEYNLETWKKGKEISYIELLPLDGIVQSPQMEKFEGNGTDYNSSKLYKTNNPDLFWAKPE